MFFPRLLALLPLLYFAFTFLDAQLPKHYIFDPAKLQELSQGAIANNPDGNVTNIFSDLVDGLRETYGEKHVNLVRDEDWFFNNAGGAMGSMVILHASLTEYLILFGTPLGTEGHSGLHLAHDYFTILSGKQQRLDAGDHYPRTYLPGDMNHLPRGMTSQYQLNGWALELAQGWIPTMLAFGFLDTLTSTLDFPNLWKTVKLTGENMVGQLLIGKI
ncbi:ERG2 and sigma1 receptor-like protein [Ascobolus immersus RN42]|uniref:C-8 sterol isomerase n=1 Tax=Ascobolus immersus RN42 TaxID=1160509 RepID=A0A3N4HBW9_ASCIM|nr:ERG2 and sigma1 receptor-like protein [Ascobolus immersus RN42]